MLTKRNTIYEKCSCFFTQPNNALFKKLFHFSLSVNINSTFALPQAFSKFVLHITYYPRPQKHLAHISMDIKTEFKVYYNIET